MPAARISAITGKGSVARVTGPCRADHPDGAAGEPLLPIRVIAARALARKGCRTPTRRIFKITRVRLQQLFLRLRLDAWGSQPRSGEGMRRDDYCWFHCRVCGPIGD